MPHARFEKPSFSPLEDASLAQVDSEPIRATRPGARHTLVQGMGNRPAWSSRGKQMIEKKHANQTRRFTFDDPLCKHCKSDA